ncbi:hypothetical protein O6H91_10G070000 [Diphasiastrum complanatum]|uniref:Uncharacterized protein n=7 Tax=Diphasiastrum complanatum TaxID=34168 RepID=A0ACC2CI36_DIPCM|nr:hypothetical protein O6H91_10G070000 [Diphasiastrum complanatum]KAJ7541669.1 hypothetical protein O6H91_10G070000 [Diphasiastrum complanatum]KAJ7541670.1 hypothetical protein O6H91_10G070000 [Diphasiastrum complanatum]KAJ7541671.1 hypothetical protein O6H91_10G070000 [Diphasiastrum complanatum]KAJ7541672.1 hypothetical protein O6H91_10G070000 [Diphasiastrum complanatum]
MGCDSPPHRPELNEVATDCAADEVCKAQSPPESPSGSRAGRLWQKVKEKYHLVEYHALPEYLRDNEYILKHYRADWPLKETLLSMFTIHNETLNIWTHLVGFLLFVSLTIYTAVEPPRFPRLPSLSNMADFQKFQSLLRSVPSLPSLPSLPSWLWPEMLSNCFPESLITSNLSNQCVLHAMKEDMTKLVAPLLWKPITRWPFFIFLGGAMFCLLSSTTCHLLSCISERMSYIMLRVDYAGIASLIAASFYPIVYYAFMCDPLWRNIYLITISCMGVATILVSLLPVFQSPKYRSFRAALFFGMGVSGIAPVLHKLFLHYDEPVVLATTGYEIAMGLFYGVGALVYATRVPERWKPGWFDIAGHSHQLFHVLVVAGAYTHYQAGLLYLQWRDIKGCDA